jgi:Phytanoyl-CoA dioxygenase (PhyH)
MSRVIGISGESLCESGFAIVPDLLDGTQCDAIGQRVLAFVPGAGSRALLDHAWCVELAKQLRKSSAVNRFLPGDAVAVQCTLFDKSPTKNWLVALHQDLSIPVSNRVNDLECSGWSEKEGQVYVQPPAHVLEQLVAVRVHIDDCPPESGALRVVPGSHTQGRMNSQRRETSRTQNGEVVVPVPRGGVLVMRPLLLHASSKASVRKPRRVLHFVFGPPRLPCGLEWRWAV